MDYKIHIKDHKNLSESVKNMADECLVCTLPVRPRQEGLQCESCDQWQHRVCNTNISRHDYRQAVRRGEPIEWTCNNCQQIYTEDTILDTVLDDQQNNTEQPNFTVVNSLLNSPSPAAESTRVDARRSFSIPEQHNESSLIDQPPSSTPGTSMEAVSSGFEIISSVSKRAQDKLFDDLGYSYTKKRENKRTTLWRCSVRSHASGVCPATVTQCGDIFTRGPRDHTHSSKSGTATAARIAQTIKDKAKENIFRPASHIVEEVVNNQLTNQPCDALQSITYLARNANYFRAKMRPAEPKDLNFDLVTGHLPDNFFRKDLTIDVRLVSENKLKREQKAKYKNLQQKIFTLWEQYIDNEISTRQLLKKCSKLNAPTE